jgi:ssDNA-binding Zn-finger/Zn-ribbon topoisomerase 1
MDTYITITGTCPHCGHSLKVCRAKTGQLYLGCTNYPRCDWRGVYDAVLQQLRDRTARLEAELTLVRMQHGATVPQDIPPEIEDQKTAMQTWADVVTERQTAMQTWTAVARKWGVSR